MAIDKNKYLLARANNLLEKFRGDEISRRIGKVYPLSAQIAILMDKDIKPDEYLEYQEFRAKIKAEVDAEILKLEQEYIFIDADGFVVYDEEKTFLRSLSLIDIFAVSFGGKVSHYIAQPISGYVMYDLNSSETAYFRSITLPVDTNFEKFSWAAVPENTIDKSLIQ